MPWAGESGVCRFCRTGCDPAYSHAVVRHVLARWASAGSEGLLAAGPSIVNRMWAACEDAEGAGTDDARLAAYRTLRDMVAWMRLPLEGDTGYGASQGRAYLRTHIARRARHSGAPPFVQATRRALARSSPPLQYGCSTARISQPSTTRGPGRTT